MGKGPKIPWVGVKIPWIWGSKYHAQGFYIPGVVGVKIPWIGIIIPWVGGSIYHV